MKFTGSNSAEKLEMRASRDTTRSISRADRTQGYTCVDSCGPLERKLGENRATRTTPKKIWRMVPRATRPAEGQTRYLKLAAVGVLCLLVLGSFVGSESGKTHRSLAGSDISATELENYEKRIIYAGGAFMKKTNNMGQLAQIKRELQGLQQAFGNKKQCPNINKALGCVKDEEHSVLLRKQNQEKLLKIYNGKTLEAMFKFLIETNVSDKVVSALLTQSKTFSVKQQTRNSLLMKFFETKEDRGKKAVREGQPVLRVWKEFCAEGAGKSFPKLWRTALNSYLGCKSVAYVNNQRGCMYNDPYDTLNGIYILQKRRRVSGSYKTYTRLTDSASPNTLNVGEKQQLQCFEQAPFHGLIAKGAEPWKQLVVDKKNFTITTAKKAFKTQYSVEIKFLSQSVS